MTCLLGRLILIHGVTYCTGLTCSVSDPVDLPVGISANHGDLCSIKHNVMPLRSRYGTGWKVFSLIKQLRTEHTLVKFLDSLENGLCFHNFTFHFLLLTINIGVRRAGYHWPVRAGGGR